MTIKTERPGGDICVVVLAAGYSSRMGSLKPALRIGGDSVIDLSVGAFICAEVPHIVVVTGHRANEVLDALYFRDVVHPAHNKNYELGMFSSVRTGVAALPDTCKAFLLSPADYPYVSPGTIAALERAFRETGSPVIYPKYGERRGGHPCLISAELIPEILAEPAESNLRAVLWRYESASTRIAVPDIGVTMDMDTHEDYERMCAKIGRRWNAGSAELLLSSESRGDYELKAAFRSAKMAKLIASVLAENGVPVDAELVYSAALLCRIRQEPNAARRLLFSRGLPKHGLIAAFRAHPAALPAGAPPERAIVFLADQLSRDGTLSPDAAHIKRELDALAGRDVLSEKP